MYIIRPATENDLHHLPEIDNDANLTLAALGVPKLENIDPYEVSFYAKHLQKSQIFVASPESDSTPVAYAILATKDSQPYLNELAVLTDHRRKGLGRKLLQRCIDAARERDGEWLSLTTYKNVPFNAPFYTQYGFVPFTPDADWPELAKTRAEEKDSGLETLPRIAMRKKIAP